MFIKTMVAVSLMVISVPIMGQDYIAHMYGHILGNVDAQPKYQKLVRQALKDFGIVHPEAVQQQKNEKRGGFTGRKFVTVAKHLEGSFGAKYCLADLEKYPEIKE